MKKLSATGLLTAFCLLLGACGDGESDKLSKEEAAELAKADNTRDFCAEFGWYGDGVCDEFCLTPDQDCTACFGEGKPFEDFRTDNKCCDGLKPVADSSWDDRLGDCISPRCPCFICTACGDGACGVGENRCNCPEDCADNCFDEGQAFEDFMTEDKCCPGLTAVPDFTFDGRTSECVGNRCPCFVCTNCGDGICGQGENPCNCPRDCADRCGGLAGTLCLRLDQVCIDDPTDDCNPHAGGRDCAGICVSGSGGQSCHATVSPFERYYERYEATESANSCRSNVDCMASGCSSEVCAAESLITTCEAIPLPEGACGCLDGQCQWMSCDE